MRKKVKNMPRRQQRAVFANLKSGGGKRARDFGDNPNIRRSHGEHTSRHKQEPWEN